MAAKNDTHTPTSSPSARLRTLMSQSNIPAQQYALAVLAKQGEWGVIVVDVDKPAPGEVLVRIESTGLNPLEWKVQTYGVQVTHYPAILGADPAGVVVEVGEGVSNLAVGDRVVFQGTYTNRLAAYKQYTVASAETVAKLPDNVSFDQAATIPIVAGASWAGLYGKKQQLGGAQLTPPWEEGGLGKYAGQPFLLFGGASSVGQIVIQLAKLSGFSPIIATASPHNAELLKSLGATHVVDRNLTADKLIETVKQITSEPIQIVYDSISQKATQNAGYDILAPGGTLIITTPRTIDEEKITEDKPVIRTYGSLHREQNRELGIQFYRHLPKYLESGALKLPSVEILPNGLNGIPQGLERLKKGQVSGYKLIARPQEATL
ncbi:hypothetical protein EIP91_009724 [Steccherinum ochraceum]|uniref:Enoyl reductase (ER) domain-containing protein n=1 Tax=Steccherinum ochraceum TaxID=92696 RepID=A0A4R0RDY3_9APHY|nr:hypothetical protein EIP91_009724 [Steccherinum ochraceum]